VNVEWKYWTYITPTPSLIPFAYSADRSKPVNTIYVFVSHHDVSFVNDDGLYSSIYIFSLTNVLLRRYKKPCIGYRVGLIVAIIWLILSVHTGIKGE
jgi:hypothetical protein